MPVLVEEIETTLALQLIRFAKDGGIGGVSECLGGHVGLRTTHVVTAPQMPDVSPMSDLTVRMF